MRHFFASQEKALWSFIATAAAGTLLWGACSGSDETPGSPAGSTATTGSDTTSSGSSGSTVDSTATTSATSATSGTTSTGAAGSAAATTSGAGGSATTTTGAGGATGGSAGATTGSGGKGGAGGTGGSAGTGGTGGSGGSMPGNGSANVTQFHRNPSRDGHYVDAAFTKAASPMLHKDMAFNATHTGNAFAQPLYFEGVAGGKNIVISATISNQITAFDATTGAVVWRKQFGTAAPGSQFGCGDMATIGIVGTPVIDAASKTVFFDAAESGPVRRVHRLSLDDGAEMMGWPVDVNAAARFGQTTFVPTVQSQRAAPIIVNGRVYFPYGGIIGDCGNYRGWVLGIQMDNPTMTQAFATTARGGGIWGAGGLSSDGTSIYAVTGNTFGGNGGFSAPATWGHGEAVLKFAAGPVFSNMAADYFRPSNWANLDATDTDLGGSGAILVDVPGATPSQLVVALGKNGVMYLLNRANLGGQGAGNGTTGEGLASARVAGNAIIQAAAAYTTAMGTYVVFKGNGMGCPMGQSGDLTAVKIGAASPPTITVAWCANQGGNGSPMVTTTNDAGADPIVWSTGGNRLRGWDGDTGTVIFNGGAANEMLPAQSKWITPIAVRGRIFVPTNSGVTAFTLTP